MSVNLAEAVEKLEKDSVMQEVQKRLDNGEDVLRILEECRNGMTVVGDKFQAGEAFLAELMLSGEIFKEVMKIIKPHMTQEASQEKKGTVIMATLQGDIHDLGKDIVVTLLEARGFEVHNLGVDVPVGALVEKVKEVKPDFVGFSSLLTPNIQVMKQTVDLLVENNLRDKLKVMIGGGITTDKAREFVGADFQTLDANEGVNYCVSVMEGN
ncbi:Methanogenic corrinoid protein MtbC1 [Desulfatibacillum alkenivorans DSM 16219]|jgi:methanogenic corrinoid protein MtbC1|uniref:Methanogenic corrinoid protein MtbC1 n=1 Tax=Desulfatibacillum alkenivorans DSM 16219 TaxID=1121393 RepID=A0A1M6XNV1_9BACT|nr:cobalamin-dependent protein [Desulfatibacillum alkenivorans]SHL07657.1 Methanogenic corrinoid protein MtbC1 [Desulfatibacillum alkenivorans DSM 16219]